MDLSSHNLCVHFNISKVLHIHKVFCVFDTFDLKSYQDLKNFRIKYPILIKQVYS